MAVTEGRLYGPNAPGTTNTVLYTVPGATSAVVKQIIITNTTASAATLTMAIGTTATVSNHFMSAVPVAANSIITLDCSIPLATTETIQALQGTSGAINVILAGYEVT